MQLSLCIGKIFGALWNLFLCPFSQAEIVQSLPARTKATGYGIMANVVSANIHPISGSGLRFQVLVGKIVRATTCIGYHCCPVNKRKKAWFSIGIDTIGFVTTH